MYSLLTMYRINNKDSDMPNILNYQYLHNIEMGMMPNKIPHEDRCDWLDLNHKKKDMRLFGFSCKFYKEK